MTTTCVWVDATWFPVGVVDYVLVVGKIYSQLALQSWTFIGFKVEAGVAEGDVLAGMESSVTLRGLRTPLVVCNRGPCGSERVSLTGGLGDGMVAFVSPMSAGTAASFGPLSVSLRRLAGLSLCAGLSTASLLSDRGCGGVLESLEDGGVGCLAEARRVGDLVEVGLRELTMLLMADDHDSCSTTLLWSVAAWPGCCWAESCWPAAPAAPVSRLLSGPFPDSQIWRGVIRQHLAGLLCGCESILSPEPPLLSVIWAIVTLKRVPTHYGSSSSRVSFR
ncbi:hypothetical protein KCU98_g93, partial [Aureobasidium melanogenum]